jgi:hypothetical protein
MTWGSVRAPMTFSTLAQRGHWLRSTANTRLSRAIQLIGAVGTPGESSPGWGRVFTVRRDTMRCRWRAFDCMAGIVPTILPHSRHCTWTCRCREAQGCARAAIHGGQMQELGRSRSQSRGREQAVVADEMGARTRHEGGQSSDEVIGYCQVNFLV